MTAIEHVLKLPQKLWLQARVDRPGHTTLEGILCVIHVELGIGGSKYGLRQEGSNPVGKLTMKLEDPWATPIIQSTIKLSSNRGHGQSIVVIANVVMKCVCSWIFMVREKAI